MCFSNMTEAATIDEAKEKVQKVVVIAREK